MMLISPFVEAVTASGPVTNLVHLVFKLRPPDKIAEMIVSGIAIQIPTFQTLKDEDRQTLQGQDDE